MEKHEHFMRFALAEAAAALQAGEFPVGCVLVRGDQVLASARRRNSTGPDTNELDHAEILVLRAFLQAAPGADCRDIAVYSTMEPCLMCFATLLLSGIRRFVWAYEDVMGGGTGLPLKQLPELYAGMRVELVSGVLRNESLILFQQFFRCHAYWGDSSLARYTLAQEATP
ncbi:MAG TPA: tRNA-specific adenosine deaminase [Desulfobulbaceae bacterium]|nr:tRNA-specific adenosine deaminase [Desulfobulbaceae bacterium]